VGADGTNGSGAEHAAGGEGSGVRSDADISSWRDAEAGVGRPAPGDSDAERHVGDERSEADGMSAASRGRGGMRQPSMALKNGARTMPAVPASERRGWPAKGTIPCSGLNKATSTATIVM